MKGGAGGTQRAASILGVGFVQFGRDRPPPAVLAALAAIERKKNIDASRRPRMRFFDMVVLDMATDEGACAAGDTRCAGSEL